MVFQKKNVKFAAAQRGNERLENEVILAKNICKNLLIGNIMGQSNVESEPI